jgi:XTP/dITP diphosphohydrolase
MSNSVSKLLIATNNDGKAREIMELLQLPQVEMVMLRQISCEEIEESGSTFLENAVLKATQYAAIAGLPALADDSGLEVEALGRRPGVHSARYGGDELGYPEKMALLLDEISNAPSTGRAARFVCAMAFSLANGEVLATSNGICSGRIATQPRGHRGFGYDPIFIPDGHTETFGELAAETKNTISHRSRALSQIIPYLRDFYAAFT